MWPHCSWAQSWYTWLLLPWRAIATEAVQKHAGWVNAWRHVGLGQSSCHQSHIDLGIPYYLRVIGVIQSQTAKVGHVWVCDSTTARVFQCQWLLLIPKLEWIPCVWVASWGHVGVWESFHNLSHAYLGDRQCQLGSQCHPGPSCWQETCLGPWAKCSLCLLMSVSHVAIKG